MVSFVRQGLELGEKVLYLKNGPADEWLLDDLASAGIPYEKYLQDGQLCLLSQEETYLLDGLFDPDRMIRMLQDETERALAEGFTALRVAGGTDWAFQRPQDVDLNMQFQARCELRAIMKFRAPRANRCN